MTVGANHASKPVEHMRITCRTAFIANAPCVYLLPSAAVCAQHVEFTSGTLSVMSVLGPTWVAPTLTLPQTLAHAAELPREISQTGLFGFTPFFCLRD